MAFQNITPTLARLDYEQDHIERRRPNVRDSTTAIYRHLTPKANSSGTLRMWDSPRGHISRYPTTTLSVPHRTFTNGEDSPRPGGEAEAVGNERPETPLTECGTASRRKALQRRKRHTYSNA